MGIFLLWLVFAIVVGAVAKNNGRSFGGYFVLSLLLSPIIGLIILLIASVNNPAHKRVQQESENEGQPLRYTYAGTLSQVTCKSCGKEFEENLASCPHCGAAKS